jgi:GAG-pre-integrase domain/Zinc knuckle
LVKTQNTNGASKSLENRITDRKSSLRPYCDHCKRAGHWSSKCRKFDGNKCHNCGKIGHQAKNCWSKKKVKDKAKEKKTGGEQASIAEEYIAFQANEEQYNFDTFDACNADANDERLIYYDWLADTATTSHVTHQRDAFIDYTPMGNTSVTGVGGKETLISGRGTVELKSTCNDTDYILRLENVLHVPGTRNNLISLGRWDAAGGRYNGGNGELILITKDGMPVAQGTKIRNHLYRMKMVIKPTTRCNKIQSHQTFIRTMLRMWEVWHRHFGHVGYTGLQKLLDRKMVDGFIVDRDSPKPDCVACTEAKQHVKSFPKSSIRNT